MSQKNLKRIESKKKKAAAFLNLIKSDADYESSKIITEDEEIPSSSSNNSNRTEKMNATSNQTMSLADEMFAEYKKIMREKQKASMQRPKVFITLDELARDDPIQTEPDAVKLPPPLFMADVQHLLLYALQGNQASIKPRWCRLLRYGKVTKVVAVVLESVSSEEFKQYPESLPTLSQAFDLKAELVSPVQYGSSAREDIMNVPISITQIKKQLSRDKQNTLFKKTNKDVKKIQTLLNCQKWSVALNWHNHSNKRKRDDEPDGADAKRSRYEFPDEVNDKVVLSTYDLDQYDRRWLMLNSAQMICEGIPTPASADDPRYHGYVFSKKSYKQVTARSPLFAVDCEMVQTKASKMDLARVSIVDENLDVVLDMFVKPDAPVTNYVTQFSGITKEILDHVTTRLPDVQRILQTNLPPDAILCGQSICSDLSSMKLFHPYVIDTSVIYNVTGDRRFKTGLKRLTSLFLRRGIQESDTGHSSVEDAQATMELVLLKLRNSLEFGDMMMSAPSVLETVDKAACIDDTDSTDADKDSSMDIGCTNSEENNESLNSESDCLKSGSDLKTSVDNLEVMCSESASISSESNGESSSLTRTLETVDSDRLDIQRRKIFYQREGGKFIENFLKRIEKQKRKGTVVDNADSIKLYPDTLPVITSSNDRESEKQTLDCIKDGAFCFTHLYGYKNHLSEKSADTDEEETKNVLWKLDRRFWKIMMGLPACSLFVVILPGRDDGGSIRSAMTFAKIT